jgi:hypothetical protein
MKDLLQPGGSPYAMSTFEQVLRSLRSLRMTTPKEKRGAVPTRNGSSWLLDSIRSRTSGSATPDTDNLPPSHL